MREHAMARGHSTEFCQEVTSLTPGTLLALDLLLWNIVRQPPQLYLSFVAEQLVLYHFLSYVNSASLEICLMSVSSIDT